MTTTTTTPDPAALTPPDPNRDQAAAIEQQTETLDCLVAAAESQADAAADLAQAAWTLLDRRSPVKAAAAAAAVTLALVAAAGTAWALRGRFGGHQ